MKSVRPIEIRSQVLINGLNLLRNRKQHKIYVLFQVLWTWVIYGLCASPIDRRNFTQRKGGRIAKWLAVKRNCEHYRESNHLHKINLQKMTENNNVFLSSLSLLGIFFNSDNVHYQIWQPWVKILNWLLKLCYFLKGAWHCCFSST